MRVLEPKARPAAQQRPRTPVARAARRPPGAGFTGLEAGPTHRLAYSPSERYGRPPPCGREPSEAGPTLKVARSGTASEREAHSAANAVMAEHPARAHAPFRIAGAPADGGGEVEAPAIVHEALRRPGQPLASEARAFMESRLGHDLGAVRIHTGALAARSAQAVKARAYAAGRDVVFGAGEYEPRAKAGRWLLAHELAHVVQHCQTPSPPAVLRRFESHEHIELGDTAAGASASRILLRCHGTDFPERERYAQWPRRWRDLWLRYDPAQRQAMVRGLTYGEVVALSGDLYAGWDELNDAPLAEVLQLVGLIHSPAATTAQYQRATGGRYLELAQANASHFSTGLAGNNLDTWRQYHRRAIAAARRGDANLAWGLNAAGDHFLTDAFSAGHIRTPRLELQQLPGGQVDSLIRHDLDNAFGVEVMNDRRRWIAYGDRLLDHPSNAIGRGFALEAVRLSRQDISTALQQRHRTPNPEQTRQFPAEALVPIPIQRGNRWSDHDYRRMAVQILGREGSYIVRRSARDEAEGWIAARDDSALARQPLSEKIRLLDALQGISVPEERYIRAMERLLGSVSTASELDALRARIRIRALLLLLDERRAPPMRRPVPAPPGRSHGGN